MTSLVLQHCFRRRLLTHIYSVQPIKFSTSTSCSGPSRKQHPYSTDGLPTSYNSLTSWQYRDRCYFSTSYTCCSQQKKQNIKDESDINEIIREIENTTALIEKEPKLEFKALYSFKYIRIVRILLRFQLIINPYYWVFVYLDPSSNLYVGSAIIASTVSVLIFSFFPRLIMKMSAGKNGDVIDTIKFSTLSWTGKRKDAFYRVEEVVPLKETPRYTSLKDLYIPVLVYGEWRKRYMLLKYCSWHNPQMFGDIMGEVVQTQAKKE